MPTNRMQNLKIDDEKRILCKKICKYCHEHNPRKIKGWTESKEKSWDFGNVYCPALKRNIIVTILPKDCPYILEQKIQRQKIKDLRKQKQTTVVQEVWVVETCFDEESWLPCDIVKKPFYLDVEQAEATKENLKNKFPNLSVRVAKYTPDL